MKIELFAIFLFSIFLVTTASGTERDHQVPWCEAQAGEIEVTLDDRTRVDCLTQDYAIEFDFAKKWAEAIGQALYYSAKTGKQAGIVLIVEDPKECRFVKRVRTTISVKELSIQLWTTPLQCEI